MINNLILILFKIDFKIKILLCLLHLTLSVGLKKE